MTDNEILHQMLTLIPGKTCKHCAKPLKRKSRNGRFPTFCSSGCRVKHWRAANRATGSHKA